jgi:hypothetical protein
MVSKERLNRYELGFGSGLSPNRSYEHLLGQILANGWWSGFAPGGQIGPRQQACWASAGSAGPCARWARQARLGRLAGFRPKSRFQIRISFSFSILFYKIQIN